MTVESNYVIAIATLIDRLKRLAPVFQPLRSKTKTKTNRTMYLFYLVIYFNISNSEKYMRAAKAGGLNGIKSANIM